MVRLKVEDLFYYDKEKLNFNSSMVRLKAINFLLSKVLIVDFNSSMVRLKASADKSDIGIMSISIPVWYD